MWSREELFSTQLVYILKLFNKNHSYLYLNLIHRLLSFNPSFSFVTDYVFIICLCSFENGFQSILASECYPLWEGRMIKLKELIKLMLAKTYGQIEASTHWFEKFLEDNERSDSASIDFPLLPAGIASGITFLNFTVLIFIIKRSWV